MPIRTKSGNSLQAYIKEIVDAGRVTEGDILFAMGRQAQRIQERTSQGIDYRGQSFAPYSIRGPYYHSPGGANRRQRQAAALHHARYYGGGRARGATSVRYASYSDFKASQGVAAPDLGGMEGSVLSNLQVSADGNRQPVDAAAATALGSYSSPATMGAIGVYDGRPQMLAEAHNAGVPSRHLPQREFLGISDEDMTMISADVAQRVTERMQGKI